MIYFCGKVTKKSNKNTTFAEIINDMRKFLVSLALMTSLQLHAQMSWNQTYQQYIDQYKDIAIEQMLRYHIPASITLAQGLFAKHRYRCRIRG